MLRFHFPLIEPDGRFSRGPRLFAAVPRSRTRHSRCSPTEVVRAPSRQPDRPQFLIEERVGVSVDPPSGLFVLGYEPPADSLADVEVDRAVSLAHRAAAEIIR